MSPVVLVAVFLFGATFGFLAGFAIAQSKEPQTPIVIERGTDGETRIVHVDGQHKYEPWTGAPLRPYSVRDDGATEYSDGEVVEQDATIIHPPDMRVIE